MRARSWPDLAVLELLVAVSEHGSLGAGARAVGMAQPNASRALAGLERSSGIALLHRSPRGSTLTAQGSVLVDWARAVLTAADDLVVGLEALRGDAVATVRVAASMTIAEHLLPRWLAEFRAVAPDVRVALDVINSSRVIEDVRAGHVRVGFIESSVPPEDLHHVVVGVDELVVVVSTNHPWAGRRTPVGAAELAGTPLVLREPGSGTRAALEAALMAAEVDAPLGAPALSLSSNAAVRTAALAGAAPAVLSRHAVAGSLERGDLCLVPVEGLAMGRRLHALWNGPRRLDGPAGKLVTLARAAS